MRDVFQFLLLQTTNEKAYLHVSQGREEGGEEEGERENGGGKEGEGGGREERERREWERREVGERGREGERGRRGERGREEGGRRRSEEKYSESWNGMIHTHSVVRGVTVQVSDLHVCTPSRIPQSTWHTL